MRYTVEITDIDDNLEDRAEFTDRDAAIACYWQCLTTYGAIGRQEDTLYSVRLYEGDRRVTSGELLAL